MTLTVRAGGPASAPLIPAMPDSSAEWLVAQGRTRQWGTAPWSADPKAVESVRRYATTGTPYFAGMDGVPAAALTLGDAPGGCLAPADEPERYLRLPASDRPFKGAGRRCRAARPRKNGFVRTEAFTHGADEWPGQVPARRVL
ncbi:GNAT family N-acetyltransferase [Streptomyces sp. NPDC001056]